MENKKIYVVEFGAFDDWEIDGYFKNEKDALEYCAIKNEKSDYDKYCVNEIDMLNKADTKGVDFKCFYCATIYHRSDEDKIKIHYRELCCGAKKVKFDLQFNKWFRIEGTFKSEEDCIKSLNNYYVEFKKYAEENGEILAIEKLREKIDKID